MALRENSAFRLFRFVQKMMPQPDNLPTAQAVLNAFGIERDISGHEKAASLSRVTFLIFTELDSLVKELRQENMTEESYQPITNAFERFSATGLASNWQQSKPVFGAALNPLRIFGETLSDEDISVSADDLTQLSAAIDSLRNEVQTSDLPDPVKAFIEEQLNIISRAIHDYPLSGIKAFRTAARESIFYEAEHSDVAATAEKAPQMTKLRSIQTKVVQMSKYAIEFSKFLGAVDSLRQHAGTALQGVHQVFHLLK
jgi:hypothetical protein